MKKVLLLGQKNDLGERLTRRMNCRGYSIKATDDLTKLKRILKTGSPDFVLCTGKIRINNEGQYYLEL